MVLTALSTSGLLSHKRPSAFALFARRRPRRPTPVPWTAKRGDLRRGMLRGMPPLQLEATAQRTDRLLSWLAAVANRSTSRRHRSRWDCPHRCSGPVGHGTGREGRLGGRWAGGRGADACFCPTGGHLVLVVLCAVYVQRANGGVLVAMQPGRSVPLAPSPAPVTHLAGGRARARGSPP